MKLSIINSVINSVMPINELVEIYRGGGSRSLSRKNNNEDKTNLYVKSA